MTEFITYLATVYLCFAFIKFMLCVPHIPRVIGVVSRLAGADRGAVLKRYVFIIPLVVAGLSLFGWVAALYREGISFFVMYSSRDVTRDCILGYRHSHEE